MSEEAGFSFWKKKLKKEKEATCSSAFSYKKEAVLGILE